MARNGKTKTIIAIATFVIFGIATWTTFILAGSDVKDTAEDAAEDVVMLKKEGCDPANNNDRRLIKLETQWETVITNQKEILKAVKEK